MLFTKLSVAGFLFLLASAKNGGFFAANAAETSYSIRKGADLLASVGVVGLCHPLTNEYSPDFPRCSGEFDTVANQRGLYEDDEEDDDTMTLQVYVVNGIGALVCVVMAALASGLTLGLLSLDPCILLIKMRAGETEDERSQAAGLLPLIQQHHMLLVTLLLLNSVAGEALPIFLHALVPEFVAVLISVVLVLIVGEIVPSALFTGSGQLRLASRLAPLVKIFMCLLWPIVWPIAKLLDLFFLDHSESNEGFNRHELAALIRIQHEERIATKQRRKLERNQLGASMTSMMQDASQVPARDLSHQSSLRDLKKRHIRNSSIHIDEINMMEGALQMKTKVAVDIYLSYRKVYAIPIDTVLNQVNTVGIYSSGYSRVPVYEGDDKTRIKGILMTRNLIVVNTLDELSVSKLPLHIPQCVPPDINLVDLVNLFQTGGCANRAGHMALVCAMPEVGNAALDQNETVPKEAGLMGIVTLEDVLEALLQEQIYDEMDVAGRLRAAPSTLSVEDPIDENASYSLM